MQQSATFAFKENYDIIFFIFFYNLRYFEDGFKIVLEPPWDGYKNNFLLQ